MIHTIQSRMVRLSALLLLAMMGSLATPAQAQRCGDPDGANVIPGFELAPFVQSLQWTHPIGLNVSLGCSAANSWPRWHPVLLTEVGISGGSAVVGVGNTWRRTGEYSRGVQLRALTTRTWGDPWGVGPEQTYVGVEVRALYQNSIGLGVLQRVDAGGSGQRILTVTLGFGL